MSTETRFPYVSDMAAEAGADTTLVPNEPSDLGVLAGAELIRLCLGGEQPAAMCADCAFRRGSVPNSCAATVWDAFGSVFNAGQFLCHHGDGARPCAGFMRAMELRYEESRKKDR
jgi:hypothetical protein